MERGNTKHSPHLDDAMAREVREEILASSRASQPPVAGEEPPDQRLIPYGETTGPTTPSPAEIAERSELGRWIPRTVLPADRDSLAGAARHAGAPDEIMAQLEQLPAGETFDTVVQVWAALGHDNEARTGRG